MAKLYTLEEGEKVLHVVAGTAHALIWGDLVTKEHVTLSVLLNTLAEEFLPLYDAKILFLAPSQQVPPLERSMVDVKLEEILLLFEIGDSEPVPEESKVRRYEPVEAIAGSFHLEGSILKSPLANLHTMLLVSRDAYLQLCRASIRHAAKPWLGTMSATTAMVRRDCLIMALR